MGRSADGLEKRLGIQYFDWSKDVLQTEGLRSEYCQSRIGSHDGGGAHTQELDALAVLQPLGGDRLRSHRIEHRDQIRHDRADSLAFACDEVLVLELHLESPPGASAGALDAHASKSPSRLGFPQ